jgi:hypothetical protein
MKLKSHSAMISRGVPSWPPVWMREFGQENYPAGEVGILEDVRRSLTENQCHLVIHYNESRYVGVIRVDDPQFFENLYRVLRESCGRSIHEIGDFDIDEIS